MPTRQETLNDLADQLAALKVAYAQWQPRPRQIPIAQQLPAPGAQGQQFQQPVPPQDPNQRHQQVMGGLMSQVVGGLAGRIRQLEVLQSGSRVPNGYSALAKVRVNNIEYLLFAHPSTDVVSVVQDPDELAVTFKAGQYVIEGRRPDNPDVVLSNFFFVYDERQSHVANARELVVRYLTEVNPFNARANHFYADLVVKAGLNDNPLAQLRTAHAFLHPAKGIRIGLLEALQRGNDVAWYAQPTEVITRVRRTVSEVMFYEAFETSRRGSKDHVSAIALFEEGLPFVGPNQEARYEKELCYNRAMAHRRRR